MSNGTDEFSNTAFGPETWSDHVTPMFARDGRTVVGIVVTAPGSTDITLTGSVAAAGDTVTLTQVGNGFQAGLKAVVDVAGGIVLTDGSGDYLAFFSQPYMAGHRYDALPGFGHFAAAGPDQACFVAGTRIRTPDRWVAVEDLRPGDLVATVFGCLPAPVVWVGSRRVRCDRHPRPWDVRPVRVAAGALAPGVPLRDLYLSPDHALLIDGALVPVRHLLNGATIAQMAQALVTYHHVELARHDVLDAEGAPAESYLETGNRASFDPETGDAAVRSSHRVPCVPLLTDGPRLFDIQSHLLLRAHALGNRLGPDPSFRVTAGDRPLVVHSTGPTYWATVPVGATTIRLDSLAVCPAETTPGSRDRRMLGVCVVGLRLDDVGVALDDPSLTEGWHLPENGMRWTLGAATLAVTPSSQPRELVVMTSHQLRYWVARTHARRATDRPGGRGIDESVMRRRVGDQRFVLQFDDGRAQVELGAEQRRPPRTREVAMAAPALRNREGNRHDHCLHFA